MKDKKQQKAYRVRSYDDEAGEFERSDWLPTRWRARLVAKPMSRRLGHAEVFEFKKSRVAGRIVEVWENGNKK